MKHGVKRAISLMLALILVIGAVPAVTVTGAAETNTSATEDTALLYEDDFDGYGSKKVSLSPGANEFCNMYLASNGSGYIENGRLYITSGSPYTAAYVMGGEMWGYYTVEADVASINGTYGWLGLTYYVQSFEKWQKGTFKSSGNIFKANGYDKGNGTSSNPWCNDNESAANDSGTGCNKDLGWSLTADTPVRLKIVANGKTATFYCAKYDADGNLGEFEKIMYLSNIPASSQGGSVGFIASGGGLWVDNLKVTRNLDEEKAKHSLLSLNFDEFTTETVLTNTDGTDPNSYYIKADKGLTMTMKDGRMYLTSTGRQFMYFNLPDAQHWTDYVVEADMAYVKEDDSGTWNALLYRAQSTSNWERANVYVGGSYNLNGWNGSEWTYIGGAAVKPAVATAEAYRMKLVVHGNKVDGYLARYEDGDNTKAMGPWTLVFARKNLPEATSKGGFVGFGLGNPGAESWVDNVEVYEYNTTYREDFYSKNTGAVGYNKTNGTRWVRNGTDGSANVANGKLTFTVSSDVPSSKNDILWLDAGTKWSDYTYEVDVTPSDGTKPVGLAYRVGGETSFLRADITAAGTFRVKIVTLGDKAYIYYAPKSGNAPLIYRLVETVTDIPEGQSIGSVGLVGAAGESFVVDNVEVYGGASQYVYTEPAPPPANVATIDMPKTGVVNPPVVVTRVDSDNYDSLAGSAVAIMDIDASLNVLDGDTTITTVAEYMTKYGKTVIPAFYLDSQEEVTSLCAYLKNNDIIDAFYVTDSTDTDLMLSARKTWGYARGILEYKSAVPSAYADRAALRRDILGCMASIALFPAKGFSADISGEFNIRCVSVWTTAGGAGDVYRGIANGVNGLVAASPETVLDVYESITAVTLSGKPTPIGHRGDLSGEYPENTIKAYEGALSNGVAGCEMDLHSSSDNQIVIMTDGTVDRTTGNVYTGDVPTFTLEELRAMDVKASNGETDKVPSLEDVLKHFQGTDAVLFLHTNHWYAYMADELVRLANLYDMQDNMIIFQRGAGTSLAEKYRTGAAFSVISGSGVYGPPDQENGLDYGIQSMIKQMAPLNGQNMPYNYDSMGQSDEFIYNMAARGYLALQSTAGDMNVVDRHLITGSGATSILFNTTSWASDYHYAIEAEDATMKTGEAIDLTKTVKKTVGDTELTCGVLQIGGDTLETGADGYTLNTPGTADVVYYADVTQTRSYGNLNYRIYSEPVTLTFQSFYPTGLTVKNRPNVTWYLQNSSSEMDLTGAEVTVTYNDGTEKTVPVTADMVSGFDTAELGTNTVTITYEDKGVQVTATLELSIVTDSGAEAAKAAVAAEAAKAAAESAKAAAEAAQAAAEAAAEAAGKNSDAAADAKSAAEAAQAKSEEAQAKAETAKAAAETAAAAAEQNNKEAAAEAAKAAEESAKAAEESAKAGQAAAASASSASDAAASAKAAEEAKTAAAAAQTKAEEAQVKAETAQAAAEAAKAEAAAAQAAAEAAKAAAGENAEAAAEAKAAAEAAQKKSEEAQAAAETAKAEAETAKAAAETAQAKAEEAQAGAETAQAAAADAAAAAAESNTEAAAAAAAAAADAAKTAKDAADVAQTAEKVAEDAAGAAESAAASAESAAESAGYAADAAESAKEAQEAQKAAEDAQAKAEEAQKAAEEAQKAAEEAKKAAEEAAAQAAEEAKKAAEEAKKAAEEAILIGAKYQSVLTIDSYAEKIDQSGYTREQAAAFAAAVSQAKDSIAAAETVDEVAAAMEAGKAAIDAASVKAEVAEDNAEVVRIYGDDRFQTSLQIANEMKRLLNKEKFDTVVVTSGLNFADALSGAYLAIEKDAPILLIDNRAKAFEANRQLVTGYINENLVEGGTVYILGGENAVPAGMDAGLEGYNVVRLAGENRYATNLSILAESGLGNRELLICSAKNFADSVSAAAAGRPILMVGNKLTEEQKVFLSGVKNDMVIIGGTAAVSQAIEEELAAYGNVTRVGGANRFETSVMISDNFFKTSTGAVLAYAKTFPDALCSGPLAYLLNAPILLTRSGNTTAGNALNGDVTFGMVIGGPGLINDETVRAIFGQSADAVIYKK